ncbi:MAG: hypothetical protein QNL04_11175 [SAR324 cluster bacterium]|nr:hypothetical protein [SAR324 cluster bacterium]
MTKNSKPNYPAPASLLPHEGDMVFVTDIKSHTSETINCSFIWDENSPYSDQNGMLPPALLIEITAQAVGILARLDQGGMPRLGFLVAVNNVKMPESPLPSGVKYNIGIENTWKDKNFGIFNATITDSDQTTLFTGQLQLLQPNPEGAP